MKRCCNFQINSDESNPNILSDIILGGSGTDFAAINFFTEDLDWYGQESFTITVNDGSSGPINQSFPVSIININDAPTLSSISNPDSVNEDEANVTIQIQPIDVDGDQLTVEAISSNNNLIPSLSSDDITNDNGTYLLVFDPLENQ